MYLDKFKYKWLLSVVLLIPLLISGCKGFDRLSKINMEYPRAEFCSECHIDIYKEWAASPHAIAFSSSSYRKATNDYQFTGCISCHAPEPNVSDGEVKSRSIFREEGVTCSSCHLEESKMVGPIEPTGKVAPHPIGVVEDRYRNSRFCGRCHEGTFKEWDKVESEDKRTCQECHMLSIKRKITQAEHLLSKIIVAMEKEVVQKQHTFSIHAKLPDIEPFDVDVKRENNQIILKLTNNLPHSLPTGDFGFRAVIVNILTIQKDNIVKPLKRFELLKEIKTAVPPKSAISWDFSVPDNATAIRCIITRHGMDPEKTDKLFEAEVVLK